MSGLEQDRALLQDLVRYADLSAAEIAKKAKINPSTLQRPLKGAATTRLSQRTLEKLREAYPGFPGWTASLKEPRAPFNHQLADRSHDLSAGPSDTLAIPMLELAYGMGGSFVDNVSDTGTIESFPSAFIRMFTQSPAQQLAFATGIGDSMEPTISDRDLLLIDRSIDAIRMNDQIWALVTGGIGMVKRVRMVHGQTLLLSDNEQVPAYQVAEDELTVIGRVVAITRRL